MIIEYIKISIKVALTATIFTLLAGVFLARLFAKHDFKGKDILEVVIILPMVIPPSIVGYGLLISIGKRGLVGKILYELFGVSIVFTWVAAAIAAAVVSLPLMYQSCKSAFQNVNHIYENAARTLGADEQRVFWKVTLPLAFPGIISGIVLAFSRALGEFGATLMVAGNIPGKTGTIPLAIYFAVESGDTRTANILMLIVLVFSFSLIYSLNLWLKKNNNA